MLPRSACLAKLLDDGGNLQHELVVQRCVHNEALGPCAVLAAPLETAT